MDFLSKVKKYKQIEIEKLKKQQAKNPFAQLFSTFRKRPVFIAEVKLRSPSEGILYPGNPVKLAQAYERANVDAISVLTDSQSFGGSLKLLHDISQSVDLPLLRKDFIFDKVQLSESIQNHADAVLLIANLLSEQKLRGLITFAYELGISPVVEVISKQELKIAVKAGAKIIGVNSRNLHTLEVNYDSALELLKSIPKSITALMFSGITKRRDVERAIEYGAQGILVGTSLLQANNIESKIKELVAMASNNFIIKICGLKDIESAKIVIKKKPIMVGLNFVPNSVRYVDVEIAQKISRLAYKQNVFTVGVFENQPIEQVISAVQAVHLDYVQLHGNEDESYCRKIPVPIIKKITLKTNLEDTRRQIERYKDIVDIFLFDRPKQGQGLLLNAVLVGKLAEKYPIMLAGGLNKDNVANTILKAGRALLGIDVSSGVERSVGIKDKQLVHDFIENARRSYEKL